MAFSTEEEETLEALKRWWNESGKSMLIGVVIFAAAYMGWTQWQRMQTSESGAASDLYEQLSAAVILSPGTQLTEEARSSAEQIVQQLKSEYASSVYALYGALFGARLAVERNDLDAAETELQWLLDNSSSGVFSATDPSLITTAQLRLARVILSKGEPQRALDLLATVTAGAYEAVVFEIRGDAYVALGMTSEAQASYQAAVEAGSTSEVLPMKLEDISVGS